MTKRIKLCQLAAVSPGQMLRIDQPDVPPLAVFNVDGEYFVTSNVCTHNVAMLTDGFLEGDIVECPLHGGCFNVRSGVPTAFPCEKPLQTYVPERDNGDLYVDV